MAKSKVEKQVEQEVKSDAGDALASDKVALAPEKEILGADKNVLLNVADVEPAPAPKAELKEVDNSAKNLDLLGDISDARGVLRAKGVADHLYSDEAVLHAWKKFKSDLKSLQYGDADPKLDLPVQSKVKFVEDKESVSVPAKAVASAEYATEEGQSKPHYKDEGNDNKPALK